MTTDLQIASIAMPLVFVSETTTEDMLLAALLQNRELSDVKMEGLLNSLSIKVPIMRKYALEEYPLGLPNASPSSTHKLADDVLEAVIEDEFSLSYGCLITFSFCAPLTAEAIIMPYLMSVRGYHLLDNGIDTPPEAWVFPSSYNGKEVIVFTTVKSIALIDNDTGARITYEASAVTFEYAMEGEWITSEIPENLYDQEYTEDYSFPAAFNLGSDYYVIGYQIIDSAGATSDVINWYYYAIGSGLHAELENTAGTLEENNSYPVVPIRYNNAYINATDDPDLYPAAVELLSKIGVSFSSLVDSLNASGSINEVDHAYVMFGIDLQTEDPVALSYLVDFFTYLSEATDQTIFDAMDSLLVDESKKSSNFWFGLEYPIAGVGENTTTPYIQDIFGSTETTNVSITNPSEILSLKEHGLNVTITYDYITSVVLTGELATEVGSTIKTVIPTEYVRDEKNDMLATSPCVLVLQQRLSTNTYREVRVVNLAHKNVIEDGLTIVTTPDYLSNPENHNLIMPLHHETVMLLGIEDRNSLYAQSLILVINAYEYVSLAWYETRLFYNIVMFATIVVSIITFQYYFVEIVDAAIVAALGVGGAFAVLSAIMTPIIKMIIMTIALKALSNVVGPEVAAIMAIVAAVVSFGLGGENFSLGGLATITPKFLLSLAMGLIKAATNLIQEEIEEVEKATEAFAAYAEEEWNKLDERIAALFPESLIPIDWLNDYTARPTLAYPTDPELLVWSIHETNPGPLTFKVLEQYHSLCLMLPQVETQKFF